MRRQLILPDDDVAFLDSLGLNWETLRESNLEWLLIYNCSVPNGYTIPTVDIAISIPSGYPISALDMAYFYPELKLTSGKVINAANVPQTLDNKSWQRWSRHRTTQNPWQPGSDNISTHFASIYSWLEKEIR